MVRSLTLQCLLQCTANPGHSAGTAVMYYDAQCVPNSLKVLQCTVDLCHSASTAELYYSVQWAFVTMKAIQCCTPVCS